MPTTVPPLLDAYVPVDLRVVEDDQITFPRWAGDAQILGRLDRSRLAVPTIHRLRCEDSRLLGVSSAWDDPIHLVLTSPPYWNLKDYPERPGQLGNGFSYTEFLDHLDAVWRRCFDLLVSGGRLVIVVGDVCLARRRNGGRHTVVPLHAAIQERCRAIGFDNLAPIFWYKIANATQEAEGNGASCLGKPYEPNAILKNDVEFVLMQRKPGGYRQPSLAARILSLIPKTSHELWFRQVWGNIPGASTRDHPAPFPVDLASRLVRMFSFVGDTVLDPFCGTGTTNFVAALWGRNSVGIDIEPVYLDHAERRLRDVLRQYPMKIRRDGESV